MTDDLLLQENQSLREQLKICIKIVKYYEPDLDESKFWHDIATCDYQEYLDYINKDKKNEKGQNDSNC